MNFSKGEVYFRVAYPDKEFRYPLIETFVYIGKNLSDEDREDTWYFQYAEGFASYGSVLKTNQGDRKVRCLRTEQLSEMLSLAQLKSELDHAATRNETNSRKSGIGLGIVLLVLGLAPQTYWFYVGYENPISPWEEGLWWIYLGSLFWVTYFASRKYRLFRSLMRLFERNSPGGKYFPLVGGALFVGFGCWVMIAELLFGP